MYQDDWLTLADKFGTSHTLTIVMPRHSMRTETINPTPFSSILMSSLPTSTLNSFLPLSYQENLTWSPPVHIDPFHTIPWQSEEAREVPLNVGQDNTIHTKYIWTSVQRLRSDDGTLALHGRTLDVDRGNSINAIRTTHTGEQSPTYRRSVGRQT